MSITQFIHIVNPHLKTEHAATFVGGNRNIWQSAQTLAASLDMESVHNFAAVAGYVRYGPIKAAITV